MAIDTPPQDKPKPVDEHSAAMLFNALIADLARRHTLAIFQEGRVNLKKRKGSKRKKERINEQ